MMIYMIIFMELCLISSVFKEVYDLIFLDEAERKYELEANRQRYIEREKKPHPDEFR